MPRRTRILAAASLLAVLVGGCAQDPLPPNVVLVLIDTVRTDRLSLYGYEQPTTPELEKLGATGVVFEQAISHVPQTLPSTSSIMTGRFPSEHGVRVNGLFKLPDSALTLAEILQKSGYQTAGFASALPLDPRFGIGQGFDHYDADFKDSVLTHERGRSVAFQGNRHNDFEQRADEATDKALTWLESRDVTRPFFLFVHYFDPHFPYTPPASQRKGFEPYDGEIAYTDQQIGRLVREIDRRTEGQPRVLVVAGDHGELLDPRRPKARHAGYLDEAVVRVPLLIQAPETLTEPKRIAEQVALSDVAPTVLDLLGREIPATMSGTSLLPLLDGRRRPSKWVFLETLYWQLEDGREDRARFGVRANDSRFLLDEIRNGDDIERKESLTDLTVAPGQRRNILPEVEATEPRRIEQLRKLIEEYRRLGRVADRMTLDPELESKLRKLGYLGGEDEK